MKFMLITCDPETARYAEKSGVDRLFVDMEVLGKADRQGHLDTHKAAHTLENVSGLRSVLTSAELMVRINPLNPNTKYEVEEVINAGADRIMLPMFRDRKDVEAIIEVVAGRVPITFLAETPKSLASLANWAPSLSGEDQVHFGLNDLSLAMGLDFLFEVLSARMLDYSAQILKELSVEFGIGGVARVGHGTLPAENIIGEHVRLGSSWVILSREFHGKSESLKDVKQTLDLKTEIQRIKDVYTAWDAEKGTQLEENHALLQHRVDLILKENISRNMGEA